MSAPSPSGAADRDLASIAEARALARRARQAWLQLAEFSQERIDAIVDAMAAAATPQAEAFARLAVEETGYGVVEDKIQKNLFASQKVHAFIRPMKTVGVIARYHERGVIEIAEPFGVVAAVVPSTNPTSTAIYKILIALKARCTIVLSPHPSAVRCISRVAEVLEEAARLAGAPPGAINWMTTVTLEGTQELMKQREVAVILATGGMGLVRAAYSAGKPAYGVGPGNAPAFIERTANVRKAVRDVITGKTFDNGLLCSSENSVVVDQPIAEAVRREFEAQGGHFLSKPDMEALARALVTPQRLPNPTLVGRPATAIAAKCGIAVPADTKVLMAPLDGEQDELLLALAERIAHAGQPLPGHGSFNRSYPAIRLIPAREPRRTRRQPSAKWSCNPTPSAREVRPDVVVRAVERRVEEVVAGEARLGHVGEAVVLDEPLREPAPLEAGIEHVLVEVEEREDPWRESSRCVRREAVEVALR